MATNAKIITTARELEAAQDNLNREVLHFIMAYPDRWIEGTNGNEHDFVHRDRVKRLKSAYTHLHTVQQARKDGNGNG